MIDFKNKYLTSHLITYLGNKRKLLPFIHQIINEIKSDLNIQKPSMLDGFSGTGCVSRLFKYHASLLFSNDLEHYSKTINTCYLANKSQIQQNKIEKLIDYVNNHKLSSNQIGFIEKHYAPKNDDDIQPNERAFFTNKNAKIIDSIRSLIEQIDASFQPFILAPLLLKASIHNNTCGVFRGFYKKNNIGHFGGTAENALNRIKAEITLDYPIFSTVECPVQILQGDINKIIENIPPIDIAYYDPPYNEHPYGANYFMLNIINDYNNPEITNGVAGQVVNWNRTLYSTTSTTVTSNVLHDLLNKTRAKFILLSYNNEGTIPLDKLQNILEKYGDVTVKKQKYIAYKGSRNFKQRKKMVDELLWILKKK